MVYFTALVRTEITCLSLCFIISPFICTLFCTLLKDAVYPRSVDLISGDDGPQQAASTTVQSSFIRLEISHKRFVRTLRALLRRYAWIGRLFQCIRSGDYYYLSPGPGAVCAAYPNIMSLFEIVKLEGKVAVV